MEIEYCDTVWIQLSRRTRDVGHKWAIEEQTRSDNRNEGFSHHRHVNCDAIRVVAIIIR